MPTAELLTSASFTIGGEKFFRHVERNVSQELAAHLDENEPAAFRIRMHRQVAAPVRPVPAIADDAQNERPAFSKMTLQAAILAAADLLNPDLEANFEADGRPAAQALTLILQRKVTDEERDEAFAVDPSRTAHPDGEAAARAARPKVVIRKVQADPSKEGAMTV
jgi:hypothetical protein